MGPHRRLLRALEQEKEVDELCPMPTEQDSEQHVFSAALLMIKIGAESVIGPRISVSRRRRRANSANPPMKSAEIATKTIIRRTVKRTFGNRIVDLDRLGNCESISYRIWWSRENRPRSRFRCNASLLLLVNSVAY